MNKFSAENGWFCRPAKFGEPVLIIGNNINGENKYKGEIGFKQGVQIDTGLVAVYLPRTRNTGHQPVFEWGTEVVRYTGTQELHKDRKNIINDPEAEQSISLISKKLLKGETANVKIEDIEALVSTMFVTTGDTKYELFIGTQFSYIKIIG
jgi:hypothetical protein